MYKFWHYIYILGISLLKSKDILITTPQKTAILGVKTMKLG